MKNSTRQLLGLTFVGLASSTLVACAPSPYQTDRQFEIVGKSGQVQFLATLDVEITAMHWPFTSGEDAVDEYKGDYVTTLENASQNLPSVVDPESLKLLIKEKLEKKVSQIDEKRFGQVKIDSIEVTDVVRFDVGVKKSIDSFLAQNVDKDGNPLFYGGSTTEIDSKEADGKGDLMARTSFVRANPLPGQSSDVIANCSFIGGGCRVTDSGTIAPGYTNQYPQSPATSPNPQ